MTALSDLEAFRLNSHMQSLGLETARRASSRFSSSSSFSPYADFPDASEMIPACKNSPSSSLPGVKASSSFFSPSMALPLQKLTFSATLTKNPRAIAALSLTRPFFVLSTPTGETKIKFVFFFNQPDL
ncbi:dead deah box helicase domain-containing protein [Cystoisospora suis]|uniref:Dead deah box helicase domain-containing protein n=1 Tax=Cystoisospora suis TaxID=483139 RepID=A0A2C6K9A6_9APIC|nr:dead deah box helicase domain-containing protein [Cystoisospora suis]